MALGTSPASSVAVGRPWAHAFQDAERIRRTSLRSFRCRFASPRRQQRGQRLTGTYATRCITGPRRDFGGFHSSAPLRGRLEDPACVLRGLNGASCEDSESAPNNYPSTETDLPRQDNPSVLKSIIQEIAPLDISLISKDVSPDSADAMKRTISGMLGLLPSSQFQVTIESSRGPLAHLLVSSMMTGNRKSNESARHEILQPIKYVSSVEMPFVTEVSTQLWAVDSDNLMDKMNNSGLSSQKFSTYTLRNGEYRLSLKRSLKNSEESSNDRSERDLARERMMEMACGVGMDTGKRVAEGAKSSVWMSRDTVEIMDRDQKVVLPEELGAVSPDVAMYIQQLQAKLTTQSKELEECRHALAALEMESMAGEEANDLLDYLRSLEPEKVAELSQPTSPEVENVINEVIDGLLANLCPDHSPTVPSFKDGMNAISKTWEENNASEVLGNANLQFSANVTASRDYLARLLFWCMLLGHYMLAVEYRLDLNRTLKTVWSSC